ncbi:hypothetical protein G436_4506 [Leptospira interrogans serovar Hardjo str. Norma]|uniref:Uncharacterized protein n=1 Tax=Leptospira interrogans serovar Hardjo str. Norma TaxID=1279460 RepID=A0A0M5LC82_LEPIR|nr:hypothetical protein G436_4506 [Leptospira interrogans serovar Hardjo str. Norma]
MTLLKLLKNSLAAISRITSIDHFMKQKQDGKFIFQQFYYL